MPYPYADITFTPSVKAAQSDNGSREFCEHMSRNDRDFVLGPKESAFIAARDHFFMATVSETGWPYVQHRGGPPGFVQVISERRFAFPDFRGNRQYISIGNLARNERASFFFIDYPNKARLKALATITLRKAEDEPQVIERFAALGYRAAIERVFIADVAALDWNCPQHITPRFTAAELTPVMGKLVDDLEALKAENAALKARLAGA
ncbi:MAG TPA: pyridoxamine 5'-phosphate oxidase family protein [Parvularculaceae bacterium]|nr:pyridoxamine 5'-phosphate oxidase family protein [Amphiplicatus sp.]HPE31140.1 pyridoxamine 5'-phosphate oxidase family protein [Parvularculaceae bacterium]HRX39944.1 pyridoxamine 5'-phosphate oxidase family protein [Parvularculaceae bacterium]